MFFELVRLWKAVKATLVWEESTLCLRAAAELLAAGLLHAAHTCEQLRASGFTFPLQLLVAVRFLSWKGLFSRVTTTVQVLVWNGYSPRFFGRELTVDER